MIDPPTEARALRAGELARQLGLSQMQIAAAVGASQSQVSRILRGGGVRQSRLLEAVCLYVEQFEAGVTVDAVRQNEELVDAIRSTWDGTAAHARALSTVIRSLAVLGAGPTRTPRAIEDDE